MTNVVDGRDQRGNWSPDSPITYPPVFVWPIRPVSAFRWFVRHYLMGWNLLYAAVAIVFWRFLTPSAATASTLAPGWIVAVLARNALLVAGFFGAWHWWLYHRRAQGNLSKYNVRWPTADGAAARRFTMGSQLRDNVFWSMASGVPIWTLVEVLMLWAHANGRLPALTWTRHPVAIVLIMCAVPAFRDVHFYASHRLLHVPALYRRVHCLHHRNTNPGPWSGLAMHPVEHVLYFTGVLVHVFIPSHPIHIIYQLVHAGIAPAPGHAGFDTVRIGSAERAVDIDTHGFGHYLHHKYFECNYADGMVQLDKWFGTFHDGTPEAHAAMKTRLRKRAQAETHGAKGPDPIRNYLRWWRRARLDSR